MDNEKFQELVLQQLQSLNEGQKSLNIRIDNMENRMGNMEESMGSMNSRMDNLEKSQNTLAAELMAVKADVKEVKTTVTKLEDDITPKIGALFDGYRLRGDQIENLRQHMDERFNSIEADTRYLVSKVSMLEKMAK